MAWRSGIFTHKCFNSPRNLVSSRVGWTIVDSLLGKGGIALGSLSSLFFSTSMGGCWLFGRTSQITS